MCLLRLLLQVRIPAWAVRRGVPPLHLAIGKSAFLAAGSAAALAAEAGHLAARGSAAAQLWPRWRCSPAGWALICWSALGPGALSAFLHVKVSRLRWCSSCGRFHCDGPWAAGQGEAPSAQVLATGPRLAALPGAPLPLRPTPCVRAGPVAGAPHHRPSCVLQRAALVCPAGGARPAKRAAGPPNAAWRLPSGSRRGGSGAPCPRKARMRRQPAWCCKRC